MDGKFMGLMFGRPPNSTRHRFTGIARSGIKHYAGHSRADGSGRLFPGPGNPTAPGHRRRMVP